LIGILALVLAMTVARQLFRGPASSEASVLVGASTASGTASTPAFEPTPRRAPLPPLPDTAARDPFAVNWDLFARAAVSAENPAGVSSPAARDAERPEWSLELTLTTVEGNGRASAVINGREVVVGDVIEGATVESIVAREVVLVAPQRGPMVLRME
jgi:hypothetical protein